MDISNRILSDIAVYMKYAKYMPELEVFFHYRNVDVSIY